MRKTPPPLVGSGRESFDLRYAGRRGIARNIGGARRIPSQKTLGSPAGFSTPLAVCLDLILALLAQPPRRECGWVMRTAKRQPTQNIAK